MNILKNYMLKDKKKMIFYKGGNTMKEWLKAAGIRAIRTFAEAMLAYIGTGALVLGDVNWLAALSAGAFGAVTAMLLALTGLPEVKPGTEEIEVK